MNNKMKIANTYLKDIINENIQKVIISSPFTKGVLHKKIVIEKVNKGYMVFYYEKKQSNQSKISINELYEMIAKFLIDYKQFHIYSVDTEFILNQTKKGEVFFNKRTIQEEAHNFEREKNYILKEGMIIPPLVDMGIFTKEGKIISSMHDKYKQINRFIEIIDDSVKQQKLNKINIIDFGCGKSYLTFVVYYYFKIIKKIDVNIIGLDLKEDVISDCNIAAKKYNYSGLTFEIGDINGYNAPFDVDMVISLHACDLATDYALFNAIKWNAKMIFSVPCCQHEINSQLKSEVIPIINRYGIAKERLSAIYTDIIRCNLLEAMSYKVQLLEFIDFDSTPKNLLIRANLTKIPDNIKFQMINEVDQLLTTINSTQKLHQLLDDDNLLPHRNKSYSSVS